MPVLAGKPNVVMKKIAGKVISYYGGTTPQNIFCRKILICRHYNLLDIREHLAQHPALSLQEM